MGRGGGGTDNQLNAAGALRRRGSGAAAAVPKQTKQKITSDLGSGDVPSGEMPTFNDAFWEQSPEQQTREVEAALDAIGMGMSADGFPKPGPVGQAILARGNQPIDASTGLQTDPKDTEQANALWVQFNDKGEVDKIEYTPERRALHSRIVGDTVLGEQAQREERGFASLAEWAKHNNVSLEEAKARGVYHQGNSVFVPDTDPAGNPKYSRGLGSLLGSDHPITLKIAREGIASLTEADKAYIKSQVELSRNGEPPRALFLMGGPAAGKTSGLKERPDLQPEHSIVVNPDEVKEALPEFDEMIEGKDPAAASITHEESSRVAKEIQALSSDLGLNMVIDGTGNNSVEKFAKKIEDVTQDGYEIDLLAVDVPTDVAVVRAAARATKTGRWVPEATIRETHQSVAKNLRVFLEDPRIRRVSVFDNTGDGGAVEIATSERGQMQVKDKALLDRVFAKADAPATRTSGKELPYKTGRGSVGGNIKPEDWLQESPVDWNKFLHKELPYYFEKEELREEITNKKISGQSVDNLIRAANRAREKKVFFSKPGQ